MKLKRFLLGALPLALLAACSSDDVPEKGDNNPSIVPDGFISVNLQLPTNSGTRAANDNFDDGAASEYNVNEGILVLFKGAKDGEGNEPAESTVTYCGAYDLGFPKVPEAGGQDGNVTVTYKRAVKVTGLSLADDDELYGLVFINNTKADITLTATELKIGETTCGVNTTFADVLALTSAASFTNVTTPGNTASSIFMTNSPLVVNTSGGSNNPGEAVVKTLVNLTKSLQPTEAEALANPAGTIYVERAVAKITCSEFLGASEIGENGIESGIEISDGTSLYVKNVEWALGNEEESSFVVRNTAGINWSLHAAGVTTSPYRMVGEKGLLQNIDKPNGVSLYRPYWCIDPKYDAQKGNPETLGEMITWNGNQVLYAHENTFDVAHQTYGNTTRVGMWVTFGVGDGVEAKTFYTRNGDKSILYFDNDGKSPLVNNVLADLSENNDVKAAWEAALNKEGDGSATAKITDCIDVVTEITNAGLLKIESISWKDSDIYKAKPSDDIFNGMIDRFNATYQYYEYKDGKAFYEVRIKHFGDDLTPWNVPSSAATVDEAYGVGSDTRDNNYLGRYGMVRNNWYDLKIGNLLKLGDPRDPAIWDSTWNDTPDDNKDQFIAVRIAVLSWAKRVQNVDF